MRERDDGLNIFGALHAAGEMNGGLPGFGETVGDERDGIDAVSFQLIEQRGGGLRVVADGTFGGEIDAALEEDFRVRRGGRGLGECREERGASGLEGAVARGLGGVDCADKEDGQGEAGGKAAQGVRASWRLGIGRGLTRYCSGAYRG